MTFTRKVTKNKIAPKDGSPAMSVVEFSLTNEVRDSLKAALQPFVLGQDMRPEILKEIIENHLPPQILAELGEFAKTKGIPTVYIIHNLPEVTRADIPQEYFRRDHVAEFNLWLGQHSYSSFIQPGLTLALGLEGQERFNDARYKTENDDYITGGNLHKHKTDVDMLSAVISDGARTRFTDMRTLKEEIAEKSLTFGAEMDEQLKNLDVPKKRDGMEVAISIVDREAMAKLKKLGAKHSQHVLIGNGDLAIWANDGHIFHQALPGSKKGKDPVRYTIGFTTNRPQEAPQHDR